eukprot:6184936-Pleurochrysis_carterae.AAC.3
MEREGQEDEGGEVKNAYQRTRCELNARGLMSTTSAIVSVGETSGTTTGALNDEIGALSDEIGSVQTTCSIARSTCLASPVMR